MSTFLACCLSLEFANTDNVIVQYLDSLIDEEYHLFVRLTSIMRVFRVAGFGFSFVTSRSGSQQSLNTVISVCVDVSKADLFSLEDVSTYLSRQEWLEGGCAVEQVACSSLPMHDTHFAAF